MITLLPPDASLAAKRPPQPSCRVCMTAARGMVQIPLLQNYMGQVRARSRPQSIRSQKAMSALRQGWSFRSTSAIPYSGHLWCRKLHARTSSDSASFWLAFRGLGHVLQPLRWFFRSWLNVGKINPWADHYECLRKVLKWGSSARAGLTNSMKLSGRATGRLA